MTTATHTPTPWAALSSGAIVPEIDRSGDYCRDGGVVLARTYMRSTRPSGTEQEAQLEKEANAAHIVRCVNSHDALVAALEDLARFNGDDEEEYMAIRDKHAAYDNTTDDEIQEILMRNAYAALSQAKGGDHA